MERKKITIVGKIAEIIDSYTIAINVGRKNGVKEGMEFHVKGVKVISDPETGKTLGSYKYNKVRVEVDRVEENYSIASTPTYPTYYSRGIVSGLVAGVENVMGSTTRNVVTSEKIGVDKNVYVGDEVVGIESDVKDASE